MPPPQGTPNPLEGPGDYSTTKTVHNDTYPAIDPTKQDLSGKAVFISGASKGLGRAMSISFAKAGSSYLAIGARSGLDSTTEAMKAAAKAAGKAEPQVLALQLDVTDQTSVENAAKEISSAFGRLDIVVNNAGVLGSPALIADSKPEDWWQIWNVNVRGPYLIAHAMIPLLLKTEGGLKTLVTTASVGAFLVFPAMSAYQPSKVRYSPLVSSSDHLLRHLQLAALRLTQFIAAEYADRGLLAYSIHPGNIPTDILAGVEMTEQIKAVLVETPELSADTVVCLSSQQREWLRGRYINCTWDMPELEKRKDEIVEGDKLKLTLNIL